MALSRYKSTDIFKNTDEDYKKVFSSRFGKLGLVQRKSTNIKIPSEEDLSSINYTTETWGMGNRLYKLSYQYYGDSQYWWLIALFNGISTEAEINYGDSIKIPLPLDLVLSLYGF